MAIPLHKGLPEATIKCRLRHLSDFQLGCPCSPQAPQRSESDGDGSSKVIMCVEEILAKAFLTKELQQMEASRIVKGIFKKTPAEAIPVQEMMQSCVRNCHDD